MFSFGLIHDVDCFVEIVRPLFDESVLESSLYCVSVHLDGQRNSIVHGYGQRLGSAHLAQTGCEDDSSVETPAKMLPSGGCKSLVGSLEDSLCSYEGPGASCHLTEHYQSLLLQFVEIIPSCPLWHQHTVDDQNPRRHSMRLENCDRFPALYKKRVFFSQLLERILDGLECVPRACGLSGSSINYQLLRILGHLRVQHAVEHPQRSLDLPVLAMKGCTSNDGWAPLVLQGSNGLMSPALSQLT